MKKFLIIVKFSSVQDFCLFYEQIVNGQVFLPSSKPLSHKTNIILKLIIPLIDEVFLIKGAVVSDLPDTLNSPGMTIDINQGLKSVLPQIKHLLAEFDQYKDLPGLSDFETDELTAGHHELTEIELEFADDDPIEDKPSPLTEEISPQTEDWDHDLTNLRMENESDDSPLKVDLANQSEFALLDDDYASDLQLQDEPDEIKSKDFSETKLQVPCEFDFLPDEEPEFQKSTIDNDAQATDIVDSDTDNPQVNKNISGVLFEDLKSMVEQDEFEFEHEEEPDLVIKRIPEKKDLTTEEREKAAPVGQFFMNLTKAILRSGYYAPGHPGADTAKAGLYEEFIGVLVGQREIMITNHHSRDGIDLMLTGILDEPVSIRILVGAGVAELFVPKLSEYCERKQLLSFALKREILPDHFYQFIDIMSDPKVDDHKDNEAGKFLTNAFIEKGITDISTVFVDDMVRLETDLPWRVEMAIHRLAKDLKVMPYFKGVSNDDIKKMKLQTVQDIIRPLKHAIYLNDFLVNCYLIAEYVTEMPAEEIEEIVVDAFSIDLLIPTSQFTYKELDSLKKHKLTHPDNEIIDRRLSGIKRILKLISRRVLVEKESGAQKFLENMYRNEILSFNELPADVQYMVNTIKMADDIRDNFGKYANVIANIKKPYEAMVYLKCFRRAAPFLIDSGDWTNLARIAKIVKQVSSKEPYNSENLYAGMQSNQPDEAEAFSKSKLYSSLEVAERPLGFIFKDSVDRIIKSYEEGDSKQRNLIDKILNSLGSLGVDIISKMLTDSNDREVRKLSYEMMISKGKLSKKWAVQVLEDTSLPWFIHRNAMMILGKVSVDEADFACVRKFHDHSNPKIREEVLNIAVSLKPYDGETLVLQSINDEDPKVRWRAFRTIQDFSPISEAAMNELLNIITLPIPKNNEEAENHINKTVHIISAINAMSFIPMSQKVEIEIIELLKSFSDGKKSLWKKVKRAVSNDHETPVLKAAIPLLGKIGSTQSKSILKQLHRSHPDLSEIIEKALLQIKL